MTCIFCDIVRLKAEAYLIHSTNNFCCFLDIDPINHGHILIVPKEHLIDLQEFNNELLLELMTTMQLISALLKNTYQPDGISIMQNGGIFDDIGHCHFHCFPRFKNDQFGWIPNDHISTDKQSLKVHQDLILDTFKKFTT